MTEGVVVGGWSYVYAAYAITWIVFAGYAASLVLRGMTANEVDDG